MIPVYYAIVAFLGGIVVGAILMGVAGWIYMRKLERELEEAERIRSSETDEESSRPG